MTGVNIKNRALLDAQHCPPERWVLRDSVPLKTSTLLLGIDAGTDHAAGDVVIVNLILLLGLIPCRHIVGTMMISAACRRCYLASVRAELPGYREILLSGGVIIQLTLASVRTDLPGH